MPRISVVIPTYNCAHFLGEAIESVRVQGWAGLEIVVVDDGSTDGTGALLSSLRGPDLVVLRQENCGPASARNAGIRRSTGDWIAFLDADDLWLPGKLRGQFDALSARPNAAFSFTDAIVRNSSGRETVVASPDGDILWSLLAGPRFGVGSVLVRRDRLDRIGFFDPALRMGEDWDMWLRLAASYEGCGVRRVLAVYRRCLDGPPKYSSELLESCTLHVLARLFSGPETDVSPGLRKLRGPVYGWHYSILAKSHLRQGRVSPALRMAAHCVRSHPKGLWFLAGRWGRDGRYPDFRP
jgi:glycosyltransferase involved in cell wall biosynthesis